MATTLDFNIFDTGNCKTLGIYDLSTYAVGQAISDPVVTVYMPGFADSVVVDFVPRKINLVNSNNLNITCTTDVNSLTNLNDGIYKVKYTIKPSATYSVEKTFLRTCKIQCKFESALLKLDILNCEDSNMMAKINKLKEIEFMIMSAIANANKCNTTLAIELYKRADKELDKIGAKCIL